MKRTILFLLLLIISFSQTIFSQTSSKDIAYINNENILSNRKSYWNSFLFNRNEKSISIEEEENSKEITDNLDPKHIFAVSFVYINKKLSIDEDDFSYAMEPNKLSPTFQGGITFTNIYNKVLGFQIGLLFESTHDSYKIYSERFYEVGLFDNYQSSHINQFSIYFPMRMQYRFNFNDYIASYIHIGLGFNFGIRADVELHDEIYLDDKTVVNDFSQNLYGNNWNYFNVLFELGVGIDIKRFQVGVSQAYGMTNAMKGKGRVQEPLAINVGFLF